MLMHGSAGVGKSRLALEFCLAYRDEWHAGFLSRDSQEPDWSRWQPLLPTLIVVDYAAFDAERTGRLLRALAGRGPADGTMRLAAPVRVLLLERTGEGDWFDRIVGFGTTKAQIEAAQAVPNLRLEALSDPWPIFEFVLGQAGKPLPDRAETLAALDGIDHERRPLFAHFIADAMAAGRDIRHLDAHRLLDGFIVDSRKAYWEPAGATPEDERLLALATMMGGLPIGALEGVTESFLPSWELDRHPELFRTITGVESGEAVPPLEPDLVGEPIALECLAKKNLPDSIRARFCALAWRLSPPGMGQFATRAHHDLPGHPMLTWLRKRPSSDGPPQLFWSIAGAQIISILRSDDPEAARVLFDEIHRVAAAYDEDGLWAAWAAAAAASIGGDLLSFMQDSVLFGPTADPERRLGASQVFYENPLIARDPEAARALVDEIRSVAAARDDPSVWRIWSYAALALMDSLIIRDPVGASQLLTEVIGASASKGDPHEPLSLWSPMVGNIVNVALPGWLDAIREVAAARDEAPLWELWARSVCIRVVELGSSQPDAARAALDDVRAVAAKRDEPWLWELWAQAAGNLVRDIGSSDPGAARVLLDDMRGVAAAHDDPSLREIWAVAATLLVSALAANDAHQAQDLREDLHNAALKFNETRLWIAWAEGASTLIDELRSHDPDALRSFVDELHRLAIERDDSDLRVKWARAAVVLTDDLRSRDLRAARALLDDLHGMAMARGELPIWGAWAMAAERVAATLQITDPAAARALGEDMRGAAAKWNEPLLWESWAKAAVNLTGVLDSLDPAAAQALLVDVRSVAATLEDAAVAQLWARATGRRIIHLGSHDPRAARSLLEEIRELAAARDEAPLWEMWGHASIILAHYLRPHNPDAARALDAAVRTLPVEILQRLGVSETEEDQASDESPPGS
jgi:hypothetical protein